MQIQAISRKAGRMQAASPAWLARLLARGGRPTLAEALAEPRPSPGVDPSAQLRWGPISSEVSQLAGAVFPTSSVVLQLGIPEKVRKDALMQVPWEVLPLPDDTKKSLVARLKYSAWLEDSHVLKNGRGPQRVRLNAQGYPQPRRRSWSVEVEAEHEDKDGDVVIGLLNYTAYGRLPEDWEARVMPRPVFTLGVYVWHASFPFLTEVSRESPPTGCQLLLYYRLFRACIGRHRDNYNTQHMLSVLDGRETIDSIQDGNHHGGDANSQMLGSNVLIWTEGDADMTFCLSFPPASNPEAPASDYVVHPTFCVPLGAGTLLIFSPVDDVFFCHEAWLSDDRGTHRLAFVFRWLSQSRKFYQATGKMKLSPELAAKATQRTHEKAKKRQRERVRQCARI